MSNVIPQPRHGRRLVLSGIALTKARNPKDDVRALAEVRDELEGIIVESRYFDAAVFSWVGLTIRFGIRSESVPHLQPICTKDGELPLAIEIETAKMQGAALSDLRVLFKVAALNALIHAGRKYGRPIEQLEAEPAKLNAPP
jgi:hypothetical protein